MVFLFFFFLRCSAVVISRLSAVITLPEFDAWAVSRCRPTLSLYHRYYSESYYLSRVNWLGFSEGYTPDTYIALLYHRGITYISPEVQ